jgi:hypothetical protein
MKIRFTVFAAIAAFQTANGFLQGRPSAHVAVSPDIMAKTQTQGPPQIILRSNFLPCIPPSPPPIQSKQSKHERFPNKLTARKTTRGMMAATALACDILLFKEPFSLIAIPYIACLIWGLPTSMFGNRKSMLDGQKIQIADKE